MKLYDILEQHLKTEGNYKSDDGELLKWVVINKVQKYDEELIALLMQNEEVKKIFFVDINGTLVFKQNLFLQFLEQKNYLNDSYTQYKNKVGLTIDGKYLKQRNEVALVWPFKDCILEGGQSREEQKREEIFFNEILAQDEITQLLELKVLTNAKRIDKDGEKQLDQFNRNENGTITDNLIIKGNNLLALHTLKKEFAGKIKLIYIDPPYNTGNDGFKYNDSFNHSTWLTFMKNRLEVARQLLREDGVIFVQISNNPTSEIESPELGYLQILLDEIFFRKNYISLITWKKKGNPGNTDGTLGTITESILFYSKNIEKIDAITENYKRSYKYCDKYGDYNLELPIKTDDGAYQRDTMKFEIITPKMTFLPPKGKRWTYGIDSINKIIENGRYEIIDKKFYIKKYRENYSLGDGKRKNNLLLDYGSLKSAKNHLAELGFDRENFDTPKPEELISTLIEMTTQQSDIVLDFHLGSGTTAAVAHKMNRQYIGIEQMDYIETVAVERLKKVITGEQGGISKSVNWQGGGSFIYLELKKYNETFIEKIQEAKDTATLLQIWEQMKTKSFLNYNIDIQEQEQHIEEFKQDTIENQKALLLKLLDLNQLYVNKSSLNDPEFECTEEEKKVTKDFFKI
jgi:adenine-specific DNA-methyltransferase